MSTMTGAAENRKIYLHIIRPKEIALRLERAPDRGPIVLDPTISWVPSLFGTMKPLKLRQTERGLVLDLPAEVRTPYDTIVVLNPKAVGR